jgi:hypothetical protein
VLFLTKHHAMKAYWESGGAWSASCPCCFTPRERAPGTDWIVGLVGSRARLDAVVRRKEFPAPTGTRTPDHPTRSQALCHWVILAPKVWGVLAEYEPKLNSNKTFSINCPVSNFIEIFWFVLYMKHADRLDFLIMYSFYALSAKNV